MVDARSLSLLLSISLKLWAFPSNSLVAASSLPRNTAKFSPSTLKSRDLGLPAGASFSWDDMEFVFSFGDSYTATSYNPADGINSSQVPFPGTRSGSGPLWVQYLTKTDEDTTTAGPPENTTPIAGNQKRSFDLASGGAVIDPSKVTPDNPQIINVNQQVAEFKKFFTPAPNEAAWKSENTLFAIWIGINDISKSYKFTNVTQPDFHKELLDVWEGLMDDLYSDGARNFLFLTVAPFWKTPQIARQAPDDVGVVKDSTNDFDDQLIDRATKLRGKHSDANFMVWDARDGFDQIQADASTYGFKNITDFCPQYASNPDDGSYGVPTQTTSRPECGDPVYEYFWLSNIHPTWAVHKVIGSKVSDFLNGQGK